MKNNNVKNNKIKNNNTKNSKVKNNNTKNNNTKNNNIKNNKSKNNNIRNNTKNSKIKKNKMKKDIIVTFSMLICFTILLIFTFVYQLHSNPSSSSPSTNKELLGEERVKVTNEIVGIIEGYISDKDLIKSYLDQKSQKSLTVKEIKEDLNLDVSKFEKNEYGCDNDFTTIDFNEDYSKHVISITCNIFFNK